MTCTSPLTTIKQNADAFTSALLAVMMALMLTLGSFQGGGFAALGIACSILLFAATWIAEGRLPHLNRSLTILLGITLITFAALNFGSFHQYESWKTLLRLISIFFPLLLLSSPAIPRSIAKYAASHRTSIITGGGVRWWAAMFAFGMVFVGVDMACGASLLHIMKGIPLATLHEALAAYHNPLIKYNRGLSYVLLLGLPVAAAVWAQHGSHKRAGAWLALMLLTAAFPLAYTDSSAALVALLVAIMVVALAFWLPKFTRLTLWLALPLMVAWPFLINAFFTLAGDQAGNWLEDIPYSWQARMELWDYTFYRIMEHPWLGWGLGTSGLLSITSPHAIHYIAITKAEPHSHNAAMQLWVETGVSGLALLLAFAGIMLRRAARLPAHISPFALGAWAYAWCIAMTAYNVWADSLWAVLTLTAFIFSVLYALFPLVLSANIRESVPLDHSKHRGDTINTVGP